MENLADLFEFAGGSTPGRKHRMDLINCHDFSVRLITGSAIAIVSCDGLTSGSHSEVGAKIGAPMIAQSAVQQIRRYPKSKDCPWGKEPPLSFWERIRLDVLAQLRVQALAMGESLSETVTEFFSFTVLGVLVTPWTSHIFGIGDGVYALNDETVAIPEFEGNKPPYLACSLIDSDLDPALLKFAVHRSVPTQDLWSLLVGTDGLNDFISAQDCTMPGTQEKVGPLSQFWTVDRYFDNPDEVRRKLAGTNKDYRKIDWANQRLIKEPGLLSDDTTLEAVRRVSLGGVT